MMDMNFVDAVAINGVRITGDGYMVGQAKCARTGCQAYMAADVGLPGSGTVNVYRPDEVVFDKASLATFAGKPITIGHPSEGVTAETWRQLAVGDIGTEIARDGEFVSVPYKIMDAAAIKAIQYGEACELSMGYTTGIEIRDGVAPDGTPYQAVQTGPIRVNHMAIVKSARGGSQLRIGDDAPWGAAPFTSDGKEIGMADTNLKTVVLGDQAVQVAAVDAQAIENFKAASAKALADAKADGDRTIAAKDAELATKDSEIAALKAKVLDAAGLDKLVADRADVIGKANVIAPAVMIDGKSIPEIKRAAVVAKSGAAMAHKSEAYIEAAFDLLCADIADPAAKALADAKGHAVSDSDKSYADRAKALSDEWKKPNTKKEAA